MIIQLNPPIPVRTPKGVAIAHLIIDDGLEHDLKWVCFQDSTGECWTFRNRFIRADTNITQGREYISPYYQPEDVAFKHQEEVIDPPDEFDEEYALMADKINEYSKEICNLKIQIDKLTKSNIAIYNLYQEKKDILDSQQDNKI